MAAIVADAGYAQGSHLPHVLVFDLSDRDVELILHPRGDRPENHSLALKGMVLRDAQSDPQGTDVHLVNRKEPRKLTARIPVNHTTVRMSNKESIYQSPLFYWSGYNTPLHFSFRLPNIDLGKA
jgi:hypothetical protein